MIRAWTSPRDNSHWFVRTYKLAEAVDGPLTNESAYALHVSFTPAHGGMGIHTENIFGRRPTLLDDDELQRLLDRARGDLDAVHSVA